MRGTCDRWHEPTTYQKLTNPTANLAAPSARTLKSWFLVTNVFKTILVAIDLRGKILNDPVFQGAGALVTVLMMLAATFKKRPYKLDDEDGSDPNMLELKLFGVVR